MKRTLRSFVVPPTGTQPVERIVMYARWALVVMYPAFAAVGAVDANPVWVAITATAIAIYGLVYQYQYAHPSGALAPVVPFGDTVCVALAYGAQSELLHPLWVVFLVGVVGGATTLGPRAAQLLIAWTMLALGASAWFILARSEHTNGLVDIVMIAAFLATLGVYVIAMGRSEQLLRAKISTLARRDALTGIANRLQLREAFEPRHAPVTGALLMIDLDNFKLWNDVRGHLAGDQLLVDVARLLTENLREADQVFRYGGDEFVVSLPGCDRINALSIAEQIRGAVAEELGATLSIGVGPYTTDRPLDEQLTYADAALYRAKKAGRNRVAAHEPQTHPGGAPTRTTAA